MNLSHINSDPDLDARFAKARQIADLLEAAGASQVLVVGGFVRDLVNGCPPADIDLEAYGLDYEAIARVLAPSFRVDVVGRAFGIVRVDNEVDVSVPRRGNLHGVGDPDRLSTMDPAMTPREAARRRDFTINSMAMTLSGELIDFFGAREDMHDKMLRATSSAFSEDPLRVLRGMQLAARFDLRVESSTMDTFRDLAGAFPDIPAERIGGEWLKWAHLGRHPGAGLRILLDSGWIRHFPEISALAECPQDPEWHPEGDVFAHTCHVCDAGAAIAERDRLDGEDRLTLMMSCLCHDLGKPGTTVRNETGRWISPKHEAAGRPLATSFLESIKAPGWLVDRVEPLVGEHMAHLRGGGNDDPSDRVVRRLSNRLAPATIRLWSALCEADHSGRPPIPTGNPVTDWVAVAEALEVQDSRPRPILMGRHLVARGAKPGPAIGKVLAQAYEAQLDGAFDTLDGAIEWLMGSPSSQVPGLKRD